VLFRKFWKKKPLEPGKFSEIVALLWLQGSEGVKAELPPEVSKQNIHKHLFHHVVSVTNEQNAST